MTSRHGIAMLHLRGDRLVARTASGVVGGEELPDGVWQGLHTTDPDAPVEVLSWVADDSVIGERVRAVMRATRFHLPAPAAWANGIGSDTAQQNQILAGHFGLPDAKRLFTGMRYCCASLARREISVMPTKRRHGGRFEGFDPPWNAEHRDVVVPASVSDVELGAAVRVAFSRCL